MTNKYNTHKLIKMASFHQNDIYETPWKDNSFQGPTNIIIRRYKRNEQ